MYSAFKLFKNIFTVACVSIGMATAAGNIQFAESVFSLGELSQGELRHIILKGKNTGDSPIITETAMSQGIGGENFKYPKEIAAGKDFQIEFDLNTEFLEGPITHTVMLIEKNGKAWPAYLEGYVKPSLMVSEKLLDAGFYKKNEKRSWIFYVWDIDGKKRPQIKLSKEDDDFKIKLTPVSLHTEKLDNIREGGKTPGLKVELSTSGIKQTAVFGSQKSLRRIIQIENKENPKAKTEILIIGYSE